MRDLTSPEYCDRACESTLKAAKSAGLTSVSSRCVARATAQQPTAIAAAAAETRMTGSRHSMRRPPAQPNRNPATKPPVCAALSARGSNQPKTSVETISETADCR